MGLFVNPITFQNDDKGRTMPYASYDFYETNTYNRKDTYSDIGLTSVNPNPVIADGAGKFPPIYLDDKNAYRVVFSEFSRPDVYSQVWEQDGVTSGLDVSSGVTSINSVADLYGLTGVDGQQISVGEYHPDTNVGGGKVKWSNGRHNGGTFIDPARTQPTPAEWANGSTDPAVIAWLADSGSDVDGWERINVEYVTPEMFGANVYSDEYLQLQSSVDASESVRLPWKLTKTSYSTSKQVNIPNNTAIEVGVSECVIDGGQISSILDAPESAILRFGEGDLTQISDLSTDVSSGDVDLAFDSAHNLVKGEIFCIYNPTDASWNAARAAYHAGEWCQVLEVVSSTAVKVAFPIFESYLAASVEVHKSDSHTVSITGGTLKAYSDTGNYSGIRGVRLTRVANSDISNLSAEVVDGHSGINIRQCFNLSGTGLKGLHSGDSGTGTDYGLLIGNSQHIHLEGYFTATRHGVSQGGANEVGAVVNRDNAIKGFIATTGGGGTVLAADWHGNCEYCVYDGLIDGGINWGGDNNKVVGKVLTNEVGVAAYASELRGFNFDFSGVNFHSDVDVGSASRGMFDCGGNSVELSADTTENGILNLSGATFYAPEVTDKIISIRNRGSTADLKINMRGLTISESNAGLSNVMQINAVSGSNFKFLDLQGYDADQSQSWTVSDVDDYRMWDERGIETIATDTGNNVESASITFRLEYPFAPSVLAVPNDPNTGASERLIAYGISVSETGFDIDLRRTDTSNFAASVSVPVSWSAG